jgi:ribosome maturation factor RimP
METSASRKLEHTLRAIAEPIAERMGCDVVAVEVLGSAASRRIVRVSLDKPGGATISDCTRVSRALSPALDVEDAIPGAYDLEVSTPGIDRPLQRERDFAYFAGCEVRIKLHGQDGRRRTKARLLGCNDGIVELQTEQGRTSVPLEEIERAHLVLDLDQYARLGQGLHPIAEGETP